MNTIAARTLATLIFGLAPGSIVQAQMGPGPGGPGGPTETDPPFSGFSHYPFEHNIVLPQIGVGTGIETSIVLVSMASPRFLYWADPTELNVRGTLRFTGSDGLPMEVAVNGNPSASTYDFQLAADSLLRFEVTAPGPLKTGWALIEVEDDNDTQETTWGMMGNQDVVRGHRLAATTFYSLTSPSGRLLSRVGVIPSVFERGFFINALMVARFDEDLNTGAALVNISDSIRRVTFRLKDSEGTILAEKTEDLSAGHHLARFVSELFSGSVQPGFQGSLEISADGDGLVALGLLLSGDILTSIPVHHFGTWQQGP